MQGQYHSKALMALLAGGLWFGGATLVAKNDNPGGNGQAKTVTEGRGGDKSKSNAPADKLRSAAGELRNSGKPTVTKAPKETGKPVDATKAAEVQRAVETVAESMETTATTTTAVVTAVESRSKVKSLLVGTDYKNLGQLRSTLVHNRNDIRALLRALSIAETDAEKLAIQASLDALMTERETIKTVIVANEDGFSLFGWVARFLANYEMTPLNTPEEKTLENEVVNALEDETNASDTRPETGNESSGTDTAVPTPTAETPPTDSTLPVEPNLAM